MKRLQLFTSLMMAVSALAACASNGAPSAAAKLDRDLEPQEVARVSPLSVKNLPQGKCGMLLWTLQGTQPVLVFRVVSGGQATMSLDGRDRQFTSLSQEGDIRYGIGTTQSYQASGSAEAEKLLATVKYGAPFTGGTYVEDGILKLISPNGWERIIPVAGLSGCR